MNYLKMLGLATLAGLALTASLGASSASGAVLCKTDTDPCEAGQDLTAGDSLTLSLRSGTNTVLKAVFGEVLCSSSHLKAKLTNTGGKAKEVEAEVTELSFTECKCGERFAHVTIDSLGSLRIDDSGTVLSLGTRTTLKCTGILSCIYGTVAGGTDIGTFTDSTDTGSTAELDGSATLTWTSGTGDSSQFVCSGFGDTASWTAQYEVTDPDEIFLSNE